MNVIARHSLPWLLSLIILIGTILAILFLWPASLPSWGKRHYAHETKDALVLTYGHEITQTFIFEQKRLSSLAVWLDAATPTKDGGLLVKIEAGGQTRQSAMPLAEVPRSGVAIFNIAPMLTAVQGTTGKLSLTLTNKNQAVYLRYQIDGSKYPDGELSYYKPNNIKGDLAFQMKYLRPALSRQSWQIVYAILLLAAGLVPLGYQYYLKKRISAGKNRGGKKDFLRGDWLAGLIIFGVTFLFYGRYFLLPGTWLGPSDFSKELSYVLSSAQALSALAWPVWSHYTCGGMGLLGNPEGTTLSLSTVLALLVPVEQALWLTLAVEAGIGAAGAYGFARLLKTRRIGAVLTAAVYGFSAPFAYKIAEGIVMVGGAFAFTPWVLLSWHQAVKKRVITWPLLSGILLAMIFWRGDVHVIFGLIGILIIWSLMDAIRLKSWQPIMVLSVTGAIFLIAASVKVLPYLEQPQLIGAKVDPHSAQITKLGLWDDIFFRVRDRSLMVPVEHGKPEHYGYVGAYIGWLPMALAMIGSLKNNKHKWHILLAIIFILILADGTLYENYLRHFGPLRALLRMPTRLLIIFPLFIGLLAAWGTAAVTKFIGKAWFKLKPSRMFNGGAIKLKGIISALTILVLFFVVTDLTSATGQILGSNLTARTMTLLPRNEQPILYPHRNYSQENRLHPSVLLQGHYLLPQVCGDQNNPPAFLKSIEKPTAISDKPTILQPNVIRVSDVPGSTDVEILERFVSSWLPSAGEVIEADNGAIHLITPAQPTSEVALRYTSATIRSQQVLLLVLIITFCTSITIIVWHININRRGIF